MSPSTDPRGARFAAALTSLVLAAALVVPTPVALALVAWQTVVFALGAGLGPAATPYAALFRAVLRPRLGAPSPGEDAHDGAPQRFAQALGLGFAATGLLLLLLGATAAGLVAVGLALVAALLNAAFGICLGCELYLTVRRLRSARTRHPMSPNRKVPS